MDTREEIDLSRLHASDIRTGVFRRRRGERGSVLVFVMLAAAVLTASVASVSDSSTTMTRSLSTDDAEAASAAAAEFGASLAIGDIAAWSKQDENAGLDYVYGEAGEKLYQDPTSGRALDNRRFQGTFGDREFRVMVRSVNLAKQNSTKPAGWLWTPESGEFLYEITSSARPKDINLASLPAERRMEAIVNEVVSVRSQDTWNGASKVGPVHPTDPANFQVAMGENIVISGEDHEINKYYVEKFETDPIVTPLKLATREANFLLADGGYWRAGSLTLNYRMYPEEPRANPHRPRTADFGSSGNNKAMYAIDPSVAFQLVEGTTDTYREYDTYLLGGKRQGNSTRGMTVTVNMDSSMNGVKGVVDQTVYSQASEGGNFNLVLGKYEDLRNLYINMAGINGNSYPVQSYIDDTSKWWQVYVGQYTNEARAMTGSNTAKAKNMPNYGSTRIRAQTAHFMKNLSGQMLVRLYKKTTTTGYGSNRVTTTTYYKYPASGTTWTGYYCWADVKYVKANITLTKNVTGSGNIPYEAAGQNVVARTFFWQELVGYQLLTRGEKGISSYPDEPAIITQQSSGSNNIDKRTIYKLGADGERIPAGFDETYQAYDNTVHGAPSTSVHPLAATEYGNRTSPGYLQNRNDAIFVWNEETGVAEKKASLDDFLFEKDFSEEGDGSLVRDAIALLIGYEDQQESGADFDYADMVFTIYISPAVEQVIQPYTMFPLLTDQWWEQNPDNGLTGNPAHPALTSNQDPSTLGVDDPHKANYDLLAYTPKADPDNPDIDTFERQVYTMRVGEGDMIDGRYMLRAKFETNPSGAFVFIPTFDEDGNEITAHPYYFTEDDVNSYIIYMWNLKKTEYGDPSYWPTAKNEFMALVPPRFTLEDIGDRWDQATVEQSILSDDAANSSYKPLDSALSLRKVAADIIGYKYQSVPVVETYEYEPVKGENNQRVPAKPEELGFLAGEMIQKPDNGSSEWVLTDLGDSIDHRRDPDSINEQKDGTVTGIREFLFEASEMPGVDINDPHAGDRNSAVNMCYVDYYAGTNLWDEVKEIYGSKDKRYSIGFHRSGDDPHYGERHSQDHYEVVFLGLKGFNPFMTTPDGKFVAKNSIIDPESGDPDYKLAYKYGNDDPVPEDGRVPDFVFNQPIDGAGVMIVNGNLIVSDVFAYHGLLLVLGDVIVRPLHRPDRLVYGDDGNPVDAYGNSLRQEADGTWYHIWFDVNDGENGSFKTTTIVRDENGVVVRDANGNTIPVAPIYATGADAVRGRLVVQGNLLVGGKMRTESTLVPGTEDEYVTGQINAYASDAASNLASGLSGIDKHFVDVMSYTSGNRAAFQDDIDRLWSGSAE